MNASIDWTGLVVIAAVLAAIGLGIRLVPGGWTGLIVKGVLVTLAVLILGVLIWNTVVALIHRTR